MSEVKRIACIGSGGVASSLLPALYGVGYKIVQVCSQHMASAQQLAKVLGADAIDNLADLTPCADMYILAVPDREIENVLSQASFGDGLVVHTSGSTAMSVFAKHEIAHCGVLYPLQTFTRQRKVNFVHVPLYVEAGNVNDLADLMFVARKLSADVSEADSEKRMQLHVAAVFACNFSNYMMSIAARLMQDSNLNFASLKPLIHETFEKAMSVEDPAQVQTGPAIRGDFGTVEKHLKALENQPDLQQLYRLITEGIMKK